MPNQRTVQQMLRAQPTSDGDGVKIRRVAGFNNTHFSPFLMVDELKSDQKSDYIGGFPPHPHRGIETLTYMLNGHFQHKDHMGNIGELRSGGAQWMAAGRGVIHSEMPIMQDGHLHGFQIWINQPASHKMLPAQYHDFQPESITEYRTPSTGLLRILAGHIDCNGETLIGPLTQTGSTLSVADWQAIPKSAIRINTPENHNVMVYVYQGYITLGTKVLREGEIALMSKGEFLELKTNDIGGVLLLMGEPINEPVVHYGPFVMNSFAEIEQAIKDYNSGLFETY
ncbi:pirin family protein [Vibrio aestuarianus]|uniref:pirin family protein n=1 Tax=Vibrio aestuarianus TaxID=28171 RepID=UPI00237C8326|nr:pirin family protein [Vibrio aestuarianus]MDE1349397.1 pirin family protein [Vibrio aestuarianus]